MVGTVRVYEERPRRFNEGSVFMRYIDVEVIVSGKGFSAGALIP